MITIDLNTILTSVAVLFIGAIGKGAYSRLNAIRDALWAQNGRIGKLEARIDQDTKMYGEFRGTERDAHKEIWGAIDGIRERIDEGKK